MVYLELDEIIGTVKAELLTHKNLGVAYYYCITKEDFQSLPLLASDFDTELTSIAYNGYMQRLVGKESLDKVLKLIELPQQSRFITLFHIVGLGLQFELHGDNRFRAILGSYYEAHSLIYKFLLAKAFNHLSSIFLREVGKVDSASNLVTQALLLIHNPNQEPSPDFLGLSKAIVEDIGIPELVVLEEYIKRRKVVFQSARNTLREIIVWSSVEIQSKHKVFNNNEDQYNSMYHSFLSKDFKVENQSQRGETLSGKMYGELDVMVFSINGYPLAIIEGFIIKSIQKAYITDHLVKLTKNYDPNGLAENFAIIYAKDKDFHLFWQRYQDFARTIRYPLPLILFEDVSSEFEIGTNIRIAKSKHSSGPLVVVIYHMFINCYY